MTFIDVTIPGWVYTHLWAHDGPMLDEHRGLWQGAHEHTVTMRMTLETRAKYLLHLEKRVREAVDTSLYNYPPLVTSAVKAFELFYWGTGYEGEPRLEGDPDDLPHHRQRGCPSAFRQLA